MPDAGVFDEGPGRSRTGGTPRLAGPQSTK